MNISGENAIKTQNEPQSFETLIERLNLIVGKSITELAKSVNVDVSSNSLSFISDKSNLFLLIISPL